MPEFNAIGQNRSEESLPIFGRRLALSIKTASSASASRFELDTNYSLAFSDPSGG